MLVIEKKSDDVTLVNFNEETKRLNIVVAEKIKNQLNAIIDDGCKKLVLDLGNIKFIDSTGFGALVTIYNHAKNRESEVVICNISAETMQLIKITKLDQVFEIKDSVEQALS